MFDPICNGIVYSSLLVPRCLLESCCTFDACSIANCHATLTGTCLHFVGWCVIVKQSLYAIAVGRHQAAARGSQWQSAAARKQHWHVHVTWDASLRASAGR